MIRKRTMFGGQDRTGGNVSSLASPSTRKPFLQIPTLILLVLVYMAGVFTGQMTEPLESMTVVVNSASAVTPPPKPQSSSPPVCHSHPASQELTFFDHNEKDCPAGKKMQIPDEGFMFHRRYIFSGIELAVTNVFHKVLGSKSPQELQDGVVLDIGGNTGWYAHLAAFCYGTKVHIFEPQPACFDVICPLMTKNNVLELVTTHNKFVSNDENLEIEVPHDGCDPGFGGFSDRKSDMAKAINPANSIPALRDSDARILMVKIDTEGNELSVLQTLDPWIANGRLNDLVAEIKFGHKKAYGENFDDKIGIYNTLFFSRGFQAYHLEGRKGLTWEKFTELANAQKSKKTDSNIHFYRSN